MQVQQGEPSLYLKVIGVDLAVDSTSEQRDPIARYWSAPKVLN